jgi:glycine C-acetyltransferase
VDIFERVVNNMGPLGQYMSFGHHYFYFPELEGELGPRMRFKGQEMLVWSLNNYLGLANHPEVRKTDAEASAQWGLAYPMGARMMTGESKYHLELEKQLAEFEGKEDAVLLNYGYQGIMSVIDALLDRKDVVVYDSQAHACIIDGLRMHLGKRFVYQHNDVESCEKQLQRAKKLTEETGGGIMVITEGVFGMSGSSGNIAEITKLKDKYDFRLLVDDAHGFGTMGKTGAGTGEAQGIQDKIDVYFSTFAKAMASIGAFVATKKSVCDYLRYNMRSQIYAKSLPMPLVIGALKRLELLKTKPELKDNLWIIVNALQNGLRERGFDIGNTNSPVTPIFLKGGVPEATKIVLDMRQNFGIFCSAVIYPVVPKDVIMLRIIPTAAHSLEDVKITLDAFEKIQEKLKNGKYTSEMPVYA